MQQADNPIDIVQEAFILPNLIAWWPTINSAYKAMEFADKITDQEKIEEYNYIAQQLNKFISSKHTQIMNGDLNKILVNAKTAFEKAPFEVRDRKFLIYLVLRDEWLNGLVALVESLIEEEEEDDEWN